MNSTTIYDVLVNSITFTNELGEKKTIDELANVNLEVITFKFSNNGKQFELSVNSLFSNINLKIDKNGKTFVYFSSLEVIKRLQHWKSFDKMRIICSHTVMVPTEQITSADWLN